MTASSRSLRGMLDKAAEKLTRAEQDLSDGFPGEASSRTYYAVFHAITAVLATRGLSFSSHMQTIGAFNREFVKSGIFELNTTRTLQHLFEHRQIADYDWASSVDAQTAAEDVAAAQTLVNLCREYVERQIKDHEA